MLVALRLAVVWGPPALGLLAFLVAVWEASLKVNFTMSCAVNVIPNLSNEEYTV